MTKTQQSSNMVATIGRHKSATARVRLTVGGTGVVTINDRELNKYFLTEVLRNAALAALLQLGREKEFDISAKVVGGGVVGQAHAVCLGIARALVELNPECKATLRANGLITRDPREKERKKPGMHGARRAPQWNKR